MAVTSRIQTEHVKFDKNYHKEALFAITNKDRVDNEHNQLQNVSYSNKGYKTRTKK